MAEQFWTIVDTTSGAVLERCYITSPAGRHPKDAGYAGWDAATRKAFKIDARPTEVQVWSGNGWADDLAKVRAQLLVAVKAEAETRKMALLSTGGAKKTEYADKKAEVAFFDSLGGTVVAALAAFNVLPAAVKEAKFAWAIADAAAFGDTIDKAVDRFRAGIKQSAKVPLIGAAEAKACAALRAATSVAALRAVVPGWPA